jgi:hypothetical protein
MGSKEELTATFDDLTRRVKDATSKLWQEMSGWTRDQQLDAGALTYYAVVKEFAHIAGVYEVDDWMLIDERAERFRPLLNDEYGNLFLGELVGYISTPSQRMHDYTMMQHNDQPTKVLSYIPYSILRDGDYTASVGPLRPGYTNLPPKKDRYRTTQGVLTLEEYNRRSREFVPSTCQDRFRYLCADWVKYHYDTPLADELFRLEQRESRLLKDKGAGLRRADVERLRGQGSATGDRRTEEPGVISNLHLVMHGVAIKKHCEAGDIVELTGLSPTTVAEELDDAEMRGRVLVADGKYMLSPAGQVILSGEYSRCYADLRADTTFVEGCERFELINAELKQLITDWQTVELAGERVVNDHSDPAYDDEIIGRLGDLHERFESVLNAMAASQARLRCYGKKLGDALERAEDGAIEWVSDAKIESYHTVWFELHEDLLRILGRERDE